jgi:hypothetical protein
MASVGFLIELTGWQALASKLTPELYNQAGLEALDQIGREGATRMQAQAPYHKGTLRGSIDYKVNNLVKAPRWVVVRTNATNAGYLYPRRLEFDSRSRHKGWMRRIMGVLRGQVAGKFAGVFFGKLKTAWER